MKTTLSVVAIYDQSAAREAAVGFCDSLVKRFWERTEFDLHWHSLEELQSGPAAAETAAKAACADIIVFSWPSATELTPSLMSWVEGWLAQRQEREGTLFDLVVTDDEKSALAASRSAFIRKVAHSSGMDYLTGIPEELTPALAATPAAYSERAGLVTGVLQEILSHARRPAPLV